MVTRSCSAGLLIWSVRQLDHLLPQVFEAGLAECRRQHGDQAVELAKFVRDQRFECSIGEDCRIGLGLHGNIADVAAGRAEDADVPLLSPQRSKIGTAGAMNRQSRSSASCGSIVLKKSSGALRQQDLDNIVSYDELLHLVYKHLRPCNESIFLCRLCCRVFQHRVMGGSSSLEADRIDWIIGRGDRRWSILPGWTSRWRRRTCVS